MFACCRCVKGPTPEFAQENLQTRKDHSELQINKLYTSKSPKLLFIKKPIKEKPDTSKPADPEHVTTKPKRETLISKPFLALPNRRDSGRESTNLSNSNINDSSRVGKVIGLPPKQIPVSLQFIHEEPSLEELEDLLEDGSELKRNSVSKTGAFSKFAMKNGTGKKFSDFIEFTKFQLLKTLQKQEAGIMIKSRLPAHKVVSMKEYRKSSRGRARTISPKKSILSKRKTSDTRNLIELSPVRKQVTFSKHNTVLIFSKEALFPVE